MTDRDGTDVVAVRTLLAGWGIHAVHDVRATASEADRTFLVATDTGVVVLKQSPSGSLAPAMQAALLNAAQRGAAELPVPRLLPHLVTGGPLSPDGTAFVSTLCPGRPLESVAPKDAYIDAIADAQALLLAALETVDAAASHVPDTNEWSLDAVVRHEPLIDRHLAERHRSAAHSIVANYRALAETALPALAHQVIHADFNLSNLLVHDGRLSGIIDFGDAVRAPRIFDVAVTAAYLALWAGSLESPLVARYIDRVGQRAALTCDEMAALPVLVRCRIVMVLALGRHTAERRPDRAEYQLRYDALAERAFDDALALSPSGPHPQRKKHQ
ncbi:phosphotransferase [Microbacterium oryzae]|uniref:phosphotransferase enzyme family protein n=1 Tax=Microbacterium oryzae TaxID=743009 RepID=UPI0025AF0805|nr:phosphotransferase [Microbacterium oryzae]MDN3310171.1 phosphotransferase [Microbacterium oryzae]